MVHELRHGPEGSFADAQAEVLAQSGAASQHSGTVLSGPQGPSPPQVRLSRPCEMQEALLSAKTRVP